MRHLILVEYADDVAPAVALATHPETPEERACLIALTPDVMDRLEQQGVSYELATTIEQQAALDEVAEENLARATQFIERVDHLLAARLPTVSNAGYSPLRCHTQELLVLLDTLAFRCVQLEALVHRGPTRRVSFFSTADEAASSLVFRPWESAWAPVCRAARDQAPAWAQRIAWHEQRSIARADKVRARIARQDRLSASEAIRRVRNGVRAHLQHVRRFARMGASPQPDPPLSAQRGARILLLGWLSPDLKAIEQALRRGRVDLWSWPTSLAASKGSTRPTDREEGDNPPTLDGDTVWDDVQHDPEIARWLIWCGISGLKAGYEQWAWFFRLRVPENWDQYCRARGQLDALRPTCVLHGEIGRHSWARTVTEAARAVHIPTVCYQWGGNYGYVQQPYLELTELQSDHFLAYTQGVQRVLAHQTAAKAGPLVHDIGSTYFARLDRAIAHVRQAPHRPSARRCIYVSTMLLGAVRHGPSHGLDDTLSSQLQRRVLAIMDDECPRRCALKLPPIQEHTVDPIRHWIAQSGRSIGVMKRPLEQVLDQADVWVIDGPSTALQQVLLTGKPVIYVETRGVRLYPKALELLRQEICVLDGWDPEFDEQFRAALRRARTGDFVPTGRFTRRFTLEHTDSPEQAARRAIAMLLNTVTAQTTNPQQDAAWELAENHR